MSISRRHLVWGAAQTILAITLLAWLFSHIEDSQELLDSMQLALHHPNWLLAGFALTLGCILICVRRWALILNQLGLPTSFRRGLHLFFIGQFFNAFLLGASGGDLVRATAIASDHKEQRTTAVTSVLIDRMLGLMALAFLACGAVLLQWNRLQPFASTHAIGWMALLSAAGGVGVLALLSSPKLAQKLNAAPLGDSETGLRATLLRAVKALHAVTRHPKTCATAIALSVLNHLMASLSIWCLARALGITLGGTGTHALSLVQELGAYLTVGPLINLVASIPLTPNALGTREAATVALLGLPSYAVPHSQALSLGLLLSAVVTIWSLISGIVYLTTRFSHRATADQAPASADPAHP